MLGEVAANERIDSTQVKAFGHFLGGVLLQKVGPTNLVVAAGRWTPAAGTRRQVRQNVHGSWGWRRQGGGCPRPSRQLSPDRGRERWPRPEGLEAAATVGCRPRCRVPGESEKTRQGPAGKLPNGPLRQTEGKRGKAGESQERVTKSGGPARKLGGLRKSAFSLETVHTVPHNPPSSSQMSKWRILLSGRMWFR